jgi:hypothetical protein
MNKKSKTNFDINFEKLSNIEVDNIDTADHPDYVDAFISYAEYEGQPVSDDVLDYINNHSSFVYEQVMKRLY